MTGRYVCVNQGCPLNNQEVRHPWEAEWPLAKRQRLCKGCRRRALFVGVVREMSAAVKQALRARRHQMV